MDAQTTTVQVPTGDGVADAIRSVPPDQRPGPGVLLFMDAFGLRPRIEEMAARIAAAGYVVLAPNLFYRHGPAPLVDLDALADPDRRGTIFGQLRPFMAALTPEAAMRDAGSYLEHLAADPEVRPGPVGAVGYCMGGALALRAAAHYPERVAAAASFHGGRLATDQPDSPHLLLDRVRGEIYAGHADNDGSMPPEDQERLETALTAAGVRHVTELYDGAAHGFTMADTAAYDEAATARHWERLLDLFERNLKR